MTPSTCIAPNDLGHLCGKPATTSRVVAGLVCALCPEHARELDGDPSKLGLVTLVGDDDEGGYESDDEDLEIADDEA